jgi:hypothetical protein
VTLALPLLNASGLTGSLPSPALTSPAAQAEFARVPIADVNLLKLPPEVGGAGRCSGCTGRCAECAGRRTCDRLSDLA